MGRNLNFSTNAGTDLLDRGTLSYRGRADQYGSPKWLEVGQARACYALMSYNTSQATGGAMFFDKFFHPVRPFSRTDEITNGQSGNGQYSASGASQNNSGLFNGVNPTQSYPANSVSSNFLNSTNSAGEFGNAMMDPFSNSTLVAAYSRNNSTNSKMYMNASFINSDHIDQRYAYLLYNGTIMAVDRIDGGIEYSAIGTNAFTITGLNANMLGAASYNDVRKELVVMNYKASGIFDLIVYQGVDFNSSKSPARFMSNPAITKTTVQVTLPSWPKNNNESQYRPLPVLCDNGDIFVTVMFTSNSLALYKLTKGAGLSFTPTLVASRTLTTSYGLENGFQYGQRSIQSRDGGAVLNFCQYYYYGSGIASFIIDKRKSSCNTTLGFNTSDSNYGHQPIPFGDDGFSCYYAGNAYAGSHSGSYLTGFFNRDGDGIMVKTGNNMYLPYFPYPNTTNYPGLTQVVDYSLLNNQSLMA